MSDDLKLFLAEKVIEKQKKELAALCAHHNKLVEAVRLLIITTQPVLGEDGHLWVTDHAIHRLAALVGEEKKYTRDTCPKSDTWFANGGSCGKAWDCRDCKDAPAALVGEE